MTNPEPVVTWEHFCEVTKLSVETLRDNARLREHISDQHKTIIDLLNQRQELFDKLVATGYSIWPEGKPL